MSKHSCCYKCPKRTAGCGVGCPDWEAERRERRSKKPDPNKIYKEYSRARHIKIAHHEHRTHPNGKKWR